MTLYLYEAHSYYNRKIVRYNNIEEYEENLGPSTYIAESISFNPNDNISTTQIVNYVLDHPYFEGTAAPSYCVVVDDTGEIVSRWWITNHSRIRKGQVNLSLIRDVIADYYDEVMSAPSFVKKGYITSPNDNAIFNNEEMSFNQIKTAEYKLKDASQCPWYVGYINKNTTVSGSIAKPNYKIAGVYETEEDYPYSQYQTTPYKGEYNDLTFKLLSTRGGLRGYDTGWDKYGNRKRPVLGVDVLDSPVEGSVVQVGTIEGMYQNDNISTTTILNYISNAAKASDVDWEEISYSYTGARKDPDILEQDGTYIQIGNKVYEVYVNSDISDLMELNISRTEPFCFQFRSVALNANDAYKNDTGSTENLMDTTRYKGNYYAAMEYSTYEYTIQLVEVPNATINYELPLNRRHCDDAVYDIIAIPADFLWVDNGAYSIDLGLSRKLVDNLIVKLGENGYDWQLLPYAPLPDAAFRIDNASQSALLTNKLGADQYTIIGNENSSYTVIVYADSSKFSKTNTQYTIDVPTNSTDFKVANETDTYRLCSPNYNGQFEFSATKNGGVSSWNISYVYKPYSPYIHIAPNFGRLYGKNFWDARGLICGGDFSISQTSDAWTFYQIQNKNYQVMFDRQIENMEVNNSIQRIMEGVNVFTGTAQGAITGGMAGGMTGNPYAAAAGAAVGGISSLGGGIADMVLNEQLRAEAMDYVKDQFGYQLQNIKALPYSLTKVDSQTSDYKKFPFVEYYTCSAVEKQALRDKVKWNGMTIMRIGEIQNFLRGEEETFIQARPIRLDYIAEDSHIAEVIAAELNTGVYII